MSSTRILFRSNQWIFLGFLLIQALYCMFLLNHYQRFRTYNLSGLQRSSWCFTSAVLNDDQYPAVTISDNEQQSSIGINHVAISRDFFRYLVSHLHNTTYPGVQSYTEYTLAYKPERWRKVSNNTKPLRVDFGPVVNDVKSFRYPIDIPPCRDATDNNSDNSNAATAVNLFVIIISAPSNFEKRNVIRQTWLRQFQQITLSSSSSVKLTVNLVGHGFVMGLTSDNDNQMRIEEESAMHGDILQIDIIDTYSNLTRKLVGTLNWIDDHCSQVDFVLKVDDDVYVNIRNLMSTMLRSLDPSTPSLYGTAADGIVRREGKFYVSVEEWPWSSYPVYSMGAFQLIAGCTIKSLLAAAQATPYFPFEDTFMGLCAEKAGVKMRFSRRALGYLNNSPHPCQVGDYISWLTDSVSGIVKSHRATGRFYKNVTQCFIANSMHGRYMGSSSESDEILHTFS